MSSAVGPVTAVSAPADAPEGGWDQPLPQLLDGVAARSVRAVAGQRQEERGRAAGAGRDGSDRIDGFVREPFVDREPAEAMQLLPELLLRCRAAPRRRRRRSRRRWGRLGGHRRAPSAPARSERSARGRSASRCAATAPGTRARASSAVASTAATSGRRVTRSTSADQKRLPLSVCARGSNGIRPRSILGPSRRRVAGRTVTAPRTAQAMTAIAAVAMPLRVLTPTMYMPAIAIATVAPETMTVRPEVRSVVSSASPIAAPRLAFGARADDEEERVVDADRHPDQQHHGLGAVFDREQLAERSEQPEAGGDRAQREQDRNERRGQRPNANRSTSSVTGIESSSARCRSRSTVRFRAWSAETSPVSSTSAAGAPRRAGHCCANALDRRPVVVSSAATTAERRSAETLELRREAERAEAPLDVADRAAVGTGARLCVEVGELASRPPEPVLVHDRVAACGFADGAVVERLRAADRAERDAGDDERDPGCDCDAAGG